MLSWKRITPLATTLMIVFAVNVTTPEPADAFIHEIIGALCSGQPEVVPPGQVRGGASQVRALIASGLITDVFMTSTEVTVFFDPDVPNSKYISIGFPVTIEDGIAPGVDLTLSPGLIPDPDFPSHFCL